MLSVFRSAKNPILTPVKARTFESLGACNPTVVVHDTQTHVFYRAMGEPDPLRTPGRPFSTIGHGIISDGEVYERSQVLTPTEPWEMYGLEDPRATYFEGKWYVFYTALGGYPFGPDNIKVACAVGSEPGMLTEKHLVTPFNAKAATLFPERINGEVILLLTAHTDFSEDHPRPTIAFARAKNIEDFWSESFWQEWHSNLSDHAIPDVRRADSEHMEIAATPIRIPQGWLLVYCHIQNYYDEQRRIFGVEAVILDAENPQKIIIKTDMPFLVPEEYYERYGIVSNIVFPSGATLEGDVLTIFYGAADTASGMCMLSLNDLLDSMDLEKRHSFLTRMSDVPIIAPIEDHAWESISVCNAAAVDIEGVVHLLYRAMGKDNTSVLGYARLDDAVTVTERLVTPAYVPREPFEQKRGKPDGNSGCEDPRMAIFNEDVYLCYTAYDGASETRVAMASIPINKFVQKDFSWSTPALITPSGVNEKDASLFPEKINGKYVFLHRLDPVLCIDQFDQLPFERVSNRCIELMRERPGMWDGIKVGIAGPPLRVAEGWLLIYHAVGPDFHYRLGAALLDESGTNVRSRTNMPILEPVLEWERVGVVPNVVFSCGSTVRENILYLYYAGADRAIGVATIPIETLIKKLLPDI